MMMKMFVSLVGVVLLAAVGLAAAFVCGMRAKWPPVVDTVRRLNRAVFNPAQMKTAGQPGAFAGVLRHTGRNSGTSYETPLSVEPVDDGFVIALVYGERTQWVKNVLAGGSAEIVLEGVTYQVDHPEVIPIDVCSGSFSAADQRFQCILGVKTALRLRKVAP